MVDALKILGLQWEAGATQWTRILDDDEKRLENKTSLSLYQIQVHGKCWHPKVSLVVSPACTRSSCGRTPTPTHGEGHGR